MFLPIGLTTPTAQGAEKMNKAKLQDSIKKRLHDYSPMIQAKILSNLGKSNKAQLEKLNDMVA